MRSLLGAAVRLRARSSHVSRWAYEGQPQTHHLFFTGVVRTELRKPLTSPAISSAAVSSAKCPASSTCTSALGTSRRYACGSDASNDRSYLPQRTRSGGCVARIQACHLGYASTLVR